MPASWVDRIFDKLTMVYGHHFIGRWSGLDLNKVKADWAHELRGFETSPQCIKYALQNLPIKAPHVGEFKALANKMPPPEYVALPAPQASEESRNTAMAMLETIRKKMTVSKEAA